MDKRQAILEAAERELAQCGSHAMTMASVARAAGVATGTLYLYFADKKALLQAVQEQVMVAATTAVNSGDDPAQHFTQRLSGFWLRLYQYFVANPDALRCWMFYIHSPECDRLALVARQEQLFAPLIDLMDQMRQRGLVKPWPLQLLGLFALDSAVALAEKQHLGLIPAVDDVTLGQLATASWQAIALNSATCEGA
ncbi:MAG: TetR/AcrR family transcriptional regulator [Gammaproteobacteria bacterium]|nr:TetR/AcrR family transcriptional regulator [Gammaproteobacteria bacterium]